MKKTNRQISRTDRPGSGFYRGESGPGVAFDDYRSSDEHETQHRHDKPGAWRRFLSSLRTSLFPLADDQVVSHAESALARDPTLDASQLSISADAGLVIVRGNVPNRRMKEKISDCLLDLNGVSSIRNELHVRPVPGPLPQEQSPTN